jgi:D-tyrosyl-tRNA(Tyr) deacylase
MSLPEYLVVLSDADPVAGAVAVRWGVGESTGASVAGVPLRKLSERAWSLRRPTLHIRDEHLERLLPADLVGAGTTLVFPSIHRSAQNVECLTVHPLGNLGPSAEVGGRARAVTPTDPRRMSAALRRLADERDRVGLPATYEATHHGPELGLPAFFIEIGFGAADAPPPEAVRLLADVIPHLDPDPRDRVALAVGGGHYAPHFTDLALKRSWAFGHIVSRHALEGLDPATARAAWTATPGAEGIVFARADDARHPVWEGVGRRLREQDAPARDRPATSGGRSASGT